MHLLPAHEARLEQTAVAVDLEQSAAGVAFLSFLDGDLAAMASAVGTHAAAPATWRFASLAALQHPYSVDLYLEKTLNSASFILVRLLGGMDYWRYGVEELAALARRRNIRLAIIPGDYRADPRLDEASTLPVEQVRALWQHMLEGGPQNLQACVALAEGRGQVLAPEQQPAVLAHAAGCLTAPAAAPRALIVFYRSTLLAEDTAAIDALAQALAARGSGVRALAVTSLKDPGALALLRDDLAAYAPDVILSATAFSALGDDVAASPLAGCPAPVLQVIMAGSSEAQWRGSQRGLSASDLAMHVALPEFDGRIAAGLISFKEQQSLDPLLEFGRRTHRPAPAHIAHVADQALAMAHLHRLAPAERHLGFVLSDYPGKQGREAYALGLDTPASVVAMAATLRDAGYDIGDLPDAAAIITHLTAATPQPCLSLAQYRQLLASWPAQVLAAVEAACGPAEADPALQDGWFSFRFMACGKLTIALQPGRAPRAAHRESYHDLNLPPAHGYIAFYLWLRHVLRLDAMVHVGTHGTLEWLPGKALALGPECYPRLLAGALPVIYPFIASNPGEAAQAKRRLGAVTLGHMPPPLVQAGLHGAALELEPLMEEYAQALALDPARADRLGASILETARACGLADDAGLAGLAPRAALAALDTCLCDVKEARIGDGLHIFGLGEPGETAGLLAALDACFVAPGPGGAPEINPDVVPTGRNLTTLDPRVLPTEAAASAGQNHAKALLDRHMQDYGEPLATMVLDLWGSAALRTGGAGLATAFALMGIDIVRDPETRRVLGTAIVPLARLGRPRVDVTLRMSGLFRDMFAHQIALFDLAVQSLVQIGEDARENPLRRPGQHGPRAFAPPAGTYGAGPADLASSTALGPREALAAAYLQASSFAYAAGDEGNAAGEAFAGRLARAQVLVHAFDMPGEDALASATLAQHAGGMAAAAGLLGNQPASWHLDTSTPGTTKLRSASAGIARALLGRATHPRWIAGQMRHGFRGAAELAETAEALLMWAHTTAFVPSSHFDRLFAAWCDNDAVRAFLKASNPGAARAIAAVFAQAQRHGYWHPRRNATLAALDELETCP
ncbi:MAG: cobaltochelatase subunit CobN [Hyphomicrobiales bacterium]|nr:cobaltochelatase subunit CobN [Hyphomicrobiales bacterium]